MNISINSTSFYAKIQFDNPKLKFQEKTSIGLTEGCLSKSKKMFSWKMFKALVSETGVFIDKLKAIKSSVKLPS